MCVIAFTLAMTIVKAGAAMAITCSGWCVPPGTAAAVSPVYVGLFPSVVFRVDTAPPTGEHGVFFDGIDSYGLGTGLIEHVMDDPPLGNRYAYVGTTASTFAALARAQEIRATGTRVWIYTIYPNENYFNVLQSLSLIRANANTEMDRFRAELAIETAAERDEWVALGPIFPDEIIEAREITVPLDPGEDFRTHPLVELEVNLNADPDSAFNHPSYMLLAE